MRPEPVPWCVPDLSGNESGYLAQAIAAGQAGPAGDFLAWFEGGVAELAGVQYAVATCSGTAALHIAFLLAGVLPGGRGDRARVDVRRDRERGPPRRGLPGSAGYRSADTGSSIPTCSRISSPGTAACKAGG